MSRTSILATTAIAVLGTTSLIPVDAMAATATSYAPRSAVAVRGVAVSRPVAVVRPIVQRQPQVNAANAARLPQVNATNVVRPNATTGVAANVRNVANNATTGVANNFVRPAEPKSSQPQ